jgi:hypothetical protein
VSDEPDDETRLVSRQIPDDATRLVQRPVPSAGPDPDDATRRSARNIADIDDKTVLVPRARATEPIADVPSAAAAARPAFVPEGVSEIPADRYGIRDSVPGAPAIERTSYGNESSRTYAGPVAPRKNGRRVLVAVALVTAVVAVAVAVIAIVVFAVL